MKKYLLALALVSLPALAAHVIHLTFRAGTVHLHLTWAEGPALETENVLRAEWHSGTDHSSIEAPAPFKVELNMPAMGHGSAPTQLERVLDDKGQPIPGVYNVRGLYFTMAGDWEVRVTLKAADGTEETQKFSVHL